MNAVYLCFWSKFYLYKSIFGVCLNLGLMILLTMHVIAFAKLFSVF